jgi:hypothetical protein
VPEQIFNPIPEFGKTRNQALRILRDSGAQLKQKERVFWAIAYLEPVTRARLLKFFDSPEFRLLGKYMMHSSITARVKELIDEGRVKCVGTERDPQTQMEVELLALGRDDRTRRPKLAPAPPVDLSAELCKAERKGFERGRTEGLTLGFVFSLCFATLCIAGYLLVRGIVAP